MLAESVSDPNLVDWNEHIAEIKLDGIRCIAVLGKETRLWARSGAEITHKFPELQSIHICVRKPCILDGEIVCSNFNGIQRRIHKEKPMDIRIASKINPAHYEVFDILSLDGEDLKRPLMQRKAIIEETLDFNLNIRPVSYWFDGVFLFQFAKEQGWEGIMAKRMRSRYQQGKRSPDWLKIKAFIEDTFCICGLTEGENERAKTFGSLILGKRENGSLVYVGNCGSGFSEEWLKSLLKTLESLRGECPFRERPKINREVLFWTKPLIACEVRFLEYNNGDGLLRFPTFRKLLLPSLPKDFQKQGGSGVEV